MPTREQWLNQGFLLSDHPFDPVRDPVHGLDLRLRKLSLTRPLDVFTNQELADYFARVGSFGAAATAVSSFLHGLGNSIDTGTPPILLIEGAGGTGRKTVGNFAAHLMKAHCIDKPSFQAIPVTTAHLGRLLFEIKLALEAHFKKSGKDTDPLQSRDRFIKPEDPDETVLAGLFGSVAQQNLGPPLLILLIGILEYKNFEWLGKLYEMLKDLNVALIFVTEENLVTERFKKAVGRGEYLGCAVRLEPRDGLAVLTDRLTLFRQAGAPAGLSPLTPYEAAAVQWIFTEGSETLAIKILLNLCRVAMNRKLSELVESKQPVPGSPGTSRTNINAVDVREAFQAALQQKGWGGRK